MLASKFNQSRCTYVRKNVDDNFDVVVKHNFNNSQVIERYKSKLKAIVRAQELAIQLGYKMLELGINIKC